MSQRRIAKAHAPSSDIAAAQDGEIRAAREGAKLRLHFRDCTPQEEAFARLYVVYLNATRAYEEAYDTSSCPTRTAITRQAWRTINAPWVQAKIREYELAQAQPLNEIAMMVLEHDRQIVEGSKLLSQVSYVVRRACRNCYGVNHKHQWRDAEEYYAALSAIADENDVRAQRKLKPKPLPSDDGGYGYDSSKEPHFACPKCEGMGTDITIIADTTRLEGPVAAVVKGVRTTANGTEVLLHDVERAKDRLLRCAGMLGDDAASVARAAAAGAAGGAAAATVVAERVKNMSADELRRAYLTLVERQS